VFLRYRQSRGISLVCIIGYQDISRSKETGSAFLVEMYIRCEVAHRRDPLGFS
jgi:hypothetical protein